MQAGLQVARPSEDGRSGVQITLPLRGAGWRSHRLADPCRQPIEQGECLREYIGIWRFESARRSVDRSVSRIDLSPAEEKEKNGECRQDYRDRASAAKVAEGRVFKPSLPSQDGSSSVIVLPTLVARSNEQDECLRDYR